MKKRHPILYEHILAVIISAFVMFLLVMLYQGVKFTYFYDPNTVTLDCNGYNQTNFGYNSFFTSDSINITHTDYEKCLKDKINLVESVVDFSDYYTVKIKFNFE